MQNWTQPGLQSKMVLIEAYIYSCLIWLKICVYFTKTK